MKALKLGNVTSEDLFKFCVNALVKVGISRVDADVIAENLVLANLRGLDSHGVFYRLPLYLDDIRKGLINPRPDIKVVKETANAALLDCDNGLGQVGGMKATELALKKSEATGVGVAGAKNINHVGMLAHYAKKIVEEGRLGILFVNSWSRTAPWGGCEAVFGTNPLCLCFPIDDEQSIILDMATSIVAAGKVGVAASKGEKIPEGWVVDKHGRTTTDPNVLMRGNGVLLPFGEYKGYGLALAMELFAGILLGEPYSKHITTPLTSQGGFFVEAIDASIFRSYDEYRRDALDLIRIIKSTKLAEGFKEILLPGELEDREYTRRSNEGIPVFEGPWNKLRRVSEDLGTELPPFKSKT